MRGDAQNGKRISGMLSVMRMPPTAYWRTCQRTLRAIRMWLRHVTSSGGQRKIQLAKGPRAGVGSSVGHGSYLLPKPIWHWANGGSSIGMGPMEPNKCLRWLRKQSPTRTRTGLDGSI